MKVEEDYEVFICGGCLKKFYGYPEFTILARNGPGPVDFKEIKICSKKCFKKVSKNLLK